MPRYLVFDLETSTYTSHKRKANAFDQRNWVVARGWKYQGDPCCSHTYHPEHDRSTTLEITDDCSLIVGFNLKFDLTYEMVQGNKSLIDFFKRGGKIWDCQYVEYLLEGQADHAQMCSLDSIVEKYGGRKKIDEVKILWEQGVQTADIPEDLLVDYLVGTEEEGRNSGDIGNTEKIFLGQAKRVQQQGMFKMIQDRMDGLLATTEMEYNGIKIDVQEAARRLKILKDKLAEADTELNAFVPAELPFEFNWGSRTQTSCIIFGGTVKYKKRMNYLDGETGELARYKATEDWPMFDKVAQNPNECEELLDGTLIYNGQRQDTFLSGKHKGVKRFKKVPVQGELKEKWCDLLYKFPGYTVPSPEWAGKATDAAGEVLYGTGADIIEELSLRDIPFLKTLGKKQTLDKEIGTYYVRIDPKKGPVGMLTCVQPHDHMLHHSLNHVNTVTTRLSANNPNMQNIPTNAINDEGEAKSEVKQMFVSRFGDEGEMIEADYSQLEVVVQGVLSRDPQLCKDLRDRIDFHCKRVAAKFKNSASPMTYEQALDWCKNEEHPDYRAGKKERTKCKVFSFQRAYGAGNAKIALETGMSLEETQALSQAEDELYPGVVKFNAAVEAQVVGSAHPFQAVGEDGEWRNYRRGYYRAPTGTLYSFRTWDSPAFLRKRGIKDSFSPPELKNYPVQGTGGEFVQAVLGLLWRHFLSNDNYAGRAFLINTVHDCVWIDCHKSVLLEVARDIKRIMESIPEFYNSRYGMNIDVPFPVEVEHGPNMNKLKGLHI